MSYTYLGTLKKGITYDKDLQSYLENNNMKVVKHLKSLNVLVIQSEEEITTEDHPFFEALEKDRKDFSI
jgi:hypothetical protein